MEIGIEIRITTPPAFISFTPIIVPISEIVPGSNNESIRNGENGIKTNKYMLPLSKYKITPIQLRINPTFFFLEFIFLNYHLEYNFVE